MSTGNDYPSSYREREVQHIVRAVQAGDCLSLIGLSGAGKSNLMRFLAGYSLPGLTFLLVDGNRLSGSGSAALLRLMRRTLGERREAEDELEATEEALADWFTTHPQSLAILVDRMDEVISDPVTLNHLRVLRDTFKYRLTFVVATRRPLPVSNEFAELVQGNSIWLGPLAESDARWNVQRFAARRGEQWVSAVEEALIRFSWGYPSFLKAACEAYAAGHPLDDLASHPAVRGRVEEFWQDEPEPFMLEKAGIAGHPLLSRSGDMPLEVDSNELTAKENLLLQYFMAHPNVVCEKNAIIQAVWPEDQLFEEGIRDSSLAQLVRRLRQKIEPSPSEPQWIQTVPGRGYLFKK